MRSLCWTSLLFLAAPALADDGGASSIIGGELAAVGEFPTVVSVSNSGICTGTLIHPEWVLTAGHCLYFQELGFSSQAQVTSATEVRFDTTRATSGGLRYSAVETIPHPDYAPGVFGDNDVGLIRLGVPVTDRPVARVNRDGGEAAVGTMATQVGYGIADNGQSGTLYKLDPEPTVSCSIVGRDNELLVCFQQGDGTGQCSGDSGGPVFADVDGVQTTIGVVSFVTGQCDFGGAAARIDAELSFLEATIGDDFFCVADGACAEECGRNGLGDDPDCPTCDGDDECGDDEVCFDERCVAAPFSPGGLGAACAGNDECDSGICATGPDAERRCSAPCGGGGGASCPSSFECLDTGGDEGACWPESGCCTAGGGDAQTTLVMLGLGALVLGRRRRRRRAAQRP